MLTTTSRRTRAAAVALAGGVAASLFAAAPATAEDLAVSRVTARPSDDTPASGQQFVVRGRLTSDGVGLAGAQVRLRSYDGVAGTWSNLEGARVRTGDDGRYRVRVVLFKKGGRLLKVVADPAGDDIATARRIVSVIVG